MKNNDQLQRLKSRISSQAKQTRSSSLDSKDSLIEIHHVLMKEYGWIPLEEFKNLPVPTLWGLLNCIKKQHETEKKAMEKARTKR